MFGCHVLWADGNVFALVWKHGRIGVKLPEENLYEKLMSSLGAEPWKWAAQAHALCIKLEKKAKPAPKKSKTKSKKLKK
jgi:hypothetical protein